MSKKGGFTLIELLLVCLILSILAVVAIPQYSKSVAKSRQSEAKIALSGMYAAEQVFSAAWGSFTDCLFQAGYVPLANVNRYYTVGYLNGGVSSLCGPGHNKTCLYYDFSTPIACTCASTGNPQWGGSTRDDCTYNNNMSANSSPATFTPSPAWMVIDQKNFVVGAEGSINSHSSLMDAWSIDQSKNILNVQSGL